MDADQRGREAALIDAAGRLIDSSLAIAQDELELARLELVEKLPLLGRDLLKLAVAAALGVIGAILATLAVAWLLADYVFGFEHVWASFALLALVLLVPAGLLASRAVRGAIATGVPVPKSALRQARAVGQAVRS